MAVNCCVRPLATDGLVGVTAMETNVAAVTVRVAAGLVTPPDAAVIFDVPAVAPVAVPVVLIVATAGVDEFQVAVLVRFCVLPSV